ncbi:MAG: Na+/H+ antiporter [Candidatus Cybelea sp.]
MTAVIVVFVAIIVLMTIANRINVAYPIVLVLGGMAIGYIPGVPTIQLPPELVLVVFLPPLLYWESLWVPTSDLRSGALWIFQMAFGLVIVTTLAVAAVAHAIVPGMGWGVAFVLGAIVSSTDELAFFAIAEKLSIPRHVGAAIEGESLVNDATSLILYSVGIAAVVGASFSFVHAAGELVLSIVVSIAIGLVVAAVAVFAWRQLKDFTLQATISVCVPFLAYLPAYYLGFSGVLAVVTTGVVLSRYTPVVLAPASRELLGGFWVTLVFLINAFIFVEVGIRFHSIVLGLHDYSPLQLIWWGLVIAMVCVLVRVLWTFAQGLIPETNEPEHESGKADWSHVAVLAWTGMRGGVSLAAALAIPLETAAGAFPYRDLLVFLTFCVLLVTLVGQGTSLPWLIKRLHVRDDGASVREERLALAATAKAALARLDELERSGTIPSEIVELHRTRLRTRLTEFTSSVDGRRTASHLTALFRQTQRETIEAQRAKLVALRNDGRIDNTVQRRLTRVLDLQTVEVQLLESTGQYEAGDE